MLARFIAVLFLLTLNYFGRATPLRPALVTVPFVDPLPIPETIKIPWYQHDLEITTDEIVSSLHRDLPPVKQWGYNGTSPGPTIEVERGHHLRVHWKSQLGTKHIFALPKDAMQEDGVPDVRTVVHLHGAVVKQTERMDRKYDSDGWPDAWIVGGEEQIADYPNKQSSRLLWYHDHAMGTTGRNVAAGLEGMYIIRDSLERTLNLPEGKYEIPLLISSRGIGPDGGLYYSKRIDREYYGNTAFVNGKLYPYLDVEPRKYRFRIVNGSNARTFAMALLNFAGRTPGPAFYQIGGDGGLFADTVVLNQVGDPKSGRLILAPAERADVVIDFSKFAGQKFLLHNNAIPDDPDASMPMPSIMAFHIGTQVTEEDDSDIPTHIRDIDRYQPEHADNTRQIVLGQMNMADGTPMMILNNASWKDAITEKPLLGSTEVWQIINTLTDSHPFHIHLVDFQVIDRTPFDVDAYNKTGQLLFTGAPLAPAANEMAFKDVVRAIPGYVTRIMMKFGPYPGYYVYHCHILEHEDMDMMRPFEIVAP